MPTKFSIYCYENIDGICSAAILVRLARLSGATYKISTLSYPTQEEDFKYMAQLKDQSIFILDFSPEQMLNLKETLDKIKSSGNKIMYWNSHHPYSVETIKLMKDYVQTIEFAGINKDTIENSPVKYCSTDLVCERFMPKDFVANTLKDIARDMEFWTKLDSRSIKLNDIIASGFDKKQLIEILSRGVYWSDFLEKKYQEYLIKKEEALKNLVEKLEIKSYLHKSYGYGFASNLLSTSDAGHKILENGNVDVAIAIFKDGKISFRRNNDVNVDLSKIAALFLGGGHTYASGGKINLFEVSLDKISSREDFLKVVEYCDRKIKDLLLN